MEPHLRLVGRYVVLRSMTVDDADNVVRWRNDPSVAQQLFGLPPRTREEHLKWFDSMLALGDRHEFVIVRTFENGSNQSIGTVGLSRINRQQGRAEYGILIGEAAARGQGMGHEASELILDYSFDELALFRIYLHVFANNQRALELYRRLGFVQEGLLRKHAMQDETLQDVLVMGILREEWAAQRDVRHDRKNRRDV